MSKPSSLLDSRWLAFEMGHQSVRIPKDLAAGKKAGWGTQVHRKLKTNLTTVVNRYLLIKPKKYMYHSVLES